MMQAANNNDVMSKYYQNIYADDLKNEATCLVMLFHDVITIFLLQERKP